MRYLLLAFALTTLCGCAWLSREVDTDELRERIAYYNDKVAVLEESLKGLEPVDPRFALVSEAIATLRAEAAKTEQALADQNKYGPKVPVWGLLLTLVPRLLTFIPGLGPALAPIAEGLADGIWNMHRTRKQKDEDDKAYGKAT